MGVSVVWATVWVTVLLSVGSLVRGDEGSHEYKQGGEVLVWVNKVGPFNNPSETYPYYGSHVPFCARAKEEQKKHSEYHYSKFDGLGSLLQVSTHTQIQSTTQYHTV